MQFTPLHKIYFDVDDGAYSKVTDREVYDSQITLTDKEAALVVEALGKENIHRGNVKTNPQKALKNFMRGSNASSESINLNLVFPKPDKDELRLYLRRDVFKPEAGEIWFLFVKDRNIHLGSMPEKEWRAIGRDDDEDSIYQGLIVKEAQISLQKPNYQIVAASLVQKRNPALARERFRIMDFRCELSNGCRLFTSRSSGKNYLEAHHFIPLAFQPLFQQSLDTLQNIVALCPFCHRAIHHADIDLTRDLIDSLAKHRTHMLDNYNVSGSDLYEYYNCETIFA